MITHSWESVTCALDDFSISPPVTDGSGLFWAVSPSGFGLYLELIPVFLVRAILERLRHGDRCSVFALDFIFLRAVAHTPVS